MWESLRMYLLFTLRRQIHITCIFMFHMRLVWFFSVLSGKDKAAAQVIIWLMDFVKVAQRQIIILIYFKMLLYDKHSNMWPMMYNHYFFIALKPVHMDIMGTTALSSVLILTLDCFVGTSVIVANQDVTQYLVVGFMVKLPLFYYCFHNSLYETFQYTIWPFKVDVLFFIIIFKVMLSWTWKKWYKVK